MRYQKMPRPRPVDRPLQYAPDAETSRLASERSVPRPAHLNFR